ncbi:MAG: STAS domain-containing protein [Actinobacteria bacterium]|nr:STAS domain-containing protein [Actinomycetota bacterium]
MKTSRDMRQAPHDNRSMPNNGFPVSGSRVVIKPGELDGTPCVRLSGELDIMTAKQVEDYLLEKVMAGSKGFILDLNGLEFMDSSGLSLLVEVHKVLSSSGNGLLVYCENARIGRLFSFTGLDLCLSIKEENIDNYGSA